MASALRTVLIVTLAATFALLAAAPSAAGQDPRSLATDALAASVTSAPEGADGEKKEITPIAPPKQGIIPSIMTLVVFGLVVTFLGTQVWPKITAGLQERQDKILGEIEAAEDARKQAKAALEQYEASLAEARAEAQKMIDDTKAQQAALAADLRAKNEKELADMRDRARRDIEAAKRAALAEIYAQTATLATSVAGKILAREVSTDDQSKLVDEAMGELSSAGSR